MNWTLFAADGPSEIKTDSYWVPFQLSEVAGEVDRHYYFLVWLTAFFFFGITGLLAYFVWKYRRRTPNQKPLPSPSHHNLMEITWTVIPTLVVIALFYVGLMVYQDLMIAPRESFKVNVTGQRWSWSFKYVQSGFDDANELHVPANTPVELTLTSTDVLHSFYIPALRTKKDAVPGRYSKMWFNARTPGTYNIFCAEYCGTSHSEMYAKLIVHKDMDDFQNWVKFMEGEIEKWPPFKLGKRVYETKGCRGCHSLDGSKGTGPSFKDLWGSRAHRTLDPTTGRLSDPFSVTENYIIESVEEPNAQVREGYPSPSAMPSFKGRLTAKEKVGLIEFLKGYGVGATPPTDDEKK
jgi:cytochrome c oxidase subunit II